jgi:SIR2-like domain
MRFLAGGPSVPDELLVARDEGRVIFFCGAGVSRARVGLAGFFGLAQQVLDALEANLETPTRKVLRAAQRIETESGVSGLVSADRIFGLLERDFETRIIQEAVANALKPHPSADLSAHRIVLDLARGLDGKVRLVTTNFDLLFESADPALKSSSPPHLPDPRRPEDLVGVTHLHGRVTEGYASAQGDGFVLSSSEFGRAYVSDGWATQFIAKLLDKYAVVFVGYTADDPPVQYLLEALNRDAGSKSNLYAFHAGSSADAESRWRHKGVQPIAYDAADASHAALWETLEQWAQRARDPEAWYQTVIAMAGRGPESLLPHERGQVAHIVGTLEGARKFAAAANVPPADWLCVFDPTVRYSKPGRLSTAAAEDGDYVDPFGLYGLDSDPPPAPIGSDNYLAKREIPSDVFNALVLTRLDQQDPGPNRMASISGHWALNVPFLADRLAQLGRWICKIAHQPGAIWWAAGKRGLHPLIQNWIRFEVERAGTSSPAQIRKAWRLLFEAWEGQPDELHGRWFQLRTAITLDGWSSALVRELAAAHRPYLTVQRPFLGAPKPPDREANAQLGDLVTPDVEYPRADVAVEIPDDMVWEVAREFRKNVEHAVALENDTSIYALRYLAPIEPDPTLAGETTQRSHGITACVLFYTNLFARLATLNPAAARQEYQSWWTGDDTVFARLRIWASADERVLADAEAGNLLAGLSDTTFWASEHQRDLLLALRKRWTTLPADSIAAIEQRLLAGPPTDDSEESPEAAQRRAWSSLSRIHWLSAQGCRFGFDLPVETARLRAAAPRWQVSYAEGAARSMESQSGWVRTETQYDGLLSVPIADLLTQAAELEGRSNEGFLQSDPFAGLVAARPIRAFSALTDAAKRADYPIWAWRAFLGTETRKTDKPRLACSIARRLSRLPTGVVGELAHPISDWLENVSVCLETHCSSARGALWQQLICALSSNQAVAQSALVRQQSQDPDWATEALNAPVGKLAQVLMKDPRLSVLEANQELPPSWLLSVEQLLALSSPARQHALAIFAHNLNWFYARSPRWSQEHLIDPMQTDARDRDAVWAGFFWGNRTPFRPLYEALKPDMLRHIESQRVTQHEHVGFLAAMLLAG